VRVERSSPSPDLPVVRHCRREATDVEQWARKTAAAHGFTQAEHVVDIFGLCADCTAARAAEAATARDDI
jgi:hypothetical protein